MIRFVTLFEKAENIHLIKDVGQIPYLMHRYFGYESTLLTYRGDDDFGYLDDEVKGLKLTRIPKVRIGSFSVSMTFHLCSKARSIDVLHLFHHREKSYLLGLLYKRINPKGVLYLKSDIAFDSLLEYNDFVSQKKGLHYRMRRALLRPFLRAADIISFETEPAYRFACERYPEHAQKFLFLSNALNIEHMHALVPPRPFAAKEKIILTVGRIGAEEKRSERLLEAAEHLDLKGWKIVFVGPVEPAFATEIDVLHERRPDLKETVICTGAIYDRQSLYAWYDRSRVFCLTSRAESFGFVLIEAMAYGCDVITTPVSSASIITDNEKVGYIVPDDEALLQRLQQAIDGELPQRAEAVIDSVTRRFDWHVILQRLHEKIIALR